MIRLHFELLKAYKRRVGRPRKRGRPPLKRPIGRPRKLLSRLQRERPSRVERPPPSMHRRMDEEMRVIDESLDNPYYLAELTGDYRVLDDPLPVSRRDYSWQIRKSLIYKSAYQLALRKARMIARGI